MKKVIKVLSVFIILLLLTGCDGNAEYNLTIEENKFIEEINVFIPKSEITGESSLESMPIEFSLNKEYYAVGNNKMYKKTLTDITDGKNMSLSYTYNESEFKDSESLACFKDIKYVNNEEYISINGTNLIKCMNGKKVTINIKTDMKVLGNNADEIIENVYKWNVDNKNYSTKNVYIKISKESVIENNRLFIVIIVLLLVCVLSYLLVIKSKKNNAI